MRPRAEPRLRKIHIEWEDMLAVLELTNLDLLFEALQDPMSLLEQLSDPEALVIRLSSGDDECYIRQTQH